MKDTINLQEINRANYLKDNWHYKRYFFKDFNYNILQNTIIRKYNSWGNETYNDITMMIDTETSKKRKDVYETVTIKHANGKIEEKNVYQPNDNHVVIWTLSIRLFDLDIATLYGRKPSELIECIKNILNVLNGKYTLFYVHNLTYDYTFLRKFFFREFGFPVEQLNVKSHYPIQIKFDNGLVLKDSLILAQRKLEKWAEDLDAPAQKQTGKWDYDKIRNQDTPVSEDELTYAEFDTLSGTQCIDILKKQLGKQLGNMPFTATGILRDELKKLASEYKAKVLFNKIVPDFETYMFLVSMFHGGFVHGNKEYLESNLLKDVQGYDFASSYIFCLLCCKYPITKFVDLDDDVVDSDYILRNSEDHAFMFTARFADIKLKDPDFPMPVLQFSKCKTVNAINDNGRIIASQFLEVNTNEIDFKLIEKYYTWDKEHSVIFNVKTAKKGYLPDWFRNHLYKLFIDKTKLKGTGILYGIQKGKLNAGYGLSVQRMDKMMFLEVFEDIIETNEHGVDVEYHEGMYKLDNSIPPEEVYLKNIKKRSVFLPYQWGVWTTSYALEHLFELGSCCKLWLYSDTDSVYGIGWNKKLVKKLNYKYRKMNEKAGFKAVNHKDKDYWLGVAETSLNDKYSEFKYMGAKRYCGRCKEDNKLHITVAGVPKSAADQLDDNILNFKKGFTFDGVRSGKKTHNYLFVDDIYIDENGNETADSVDLSPCDYNLDVVEYHSLEEYLGTPDYVTIPYYSDEGWVSVG